MDGNKSKNAPYGARTRDPGLIRSVLWPTELKERNKYEIQEQLCSHTHLTIYPYI